MNLKLLRQVLGTSKRKSITICKGTKGTVCISFRALESLAERKIAGMKEIEKARVTMVPMALGAGMIIQLTVSPSDNIPSLAKTVKETVRDEITTLTGIRLQKVQVIKKLNNSRSRVR